MRPQSDRSEKGPGRGVRGRAADVWLVSRITLWAVMSPVLYRILPLPSFVQLMTPSAPEKQLTPELLDRGARISSFVSFVAGRKKERIGRMCLWRSILQYRFLRQAGIPAVFCVGVRKSGRDMEGHAWVEVEGRKYFDPREDTDFSVTFKSPAEQG